MTFDELIAGSRAPNKLRKFIECYKTAQADRPLALQTDLPMRDLAPLLANITLLEAESRSQIIYRVAGQNIIEKLNFNPTGRNFLDFLAPPVREASILGHELMQQHPCGYYMVYENVFESGHREVMETLTLPLRKSIDDESNLFASCHIDHQLSGFSEQKGDTAMIVNWETSVFIDIGNGKPDSDLMSDASHLAELSSMQN